MSDPQILSSAIFRSGPVPEVTVEWLASHLADVRLVDCREADELVSPLGAVRDVEHVPLGDFPEAAGAWDKAAPLVIICRSGARSGQAAMFLERNGFSCVASAAGGMIAWRQRVGAP